MSDKIQLIQEFIIACTPAITSIVGILATIFYGIVKIRNNVKKSEIDLTETRKIVTDSQAEIKKIMETYLETVKTLETQNRDLQEKVDQLQKSKYRVVKK